MKDYLKIALDAAREGGEVLRHYWGNLAEVRDKKIAGDLVTEADKESEQRILDLLRRECPGHGILAEESGSHEAAVADFLWIIDPLDGTINYAHQYPCVAVSVALFFKQSPLVGVVFNPMTQELFAASKGNGAFLNGRKLGVSSVNRLERSLLVTGFPYDRRENKDNNYREFSHLTDLSQGVRRSGSAALDLASVATGRCDAYWERGIQPWDIAAGALLVEEAGGKISSYDGSPMDYFSGKIVASNGSIHQQLIQELTLIRKKIAYE